MWVRPSGYVIGALVAGTVSVAGLSREPDVLLPAVALWVAVDAGFGTGLRSLRLLVRRLRRNPPVSALAVRRLSAALVLSLAAGSVLLALMPDLVQRLLLGTLAVGVVTAAMAAGLPHRQADALVTGLLVTAGWMAACLVQTGELSPLVLLGVAAGLGTGARLWHAGSPTGTSLWLARACWVTLFAIVVVARQPLLAGLVALTGLADDLYRVQPVREGNAGRLAAASWVCAWILVSLAATYWHVAV